MVFTELVVFRGVGLSAFVAFLRHAGWSVYFIYLFIYCVAWRGVACSVHGALGWDPCGVYSVSRFLLGIGVGRLLRFSGIWASHLCGIQSVCSIYGALGLDPCGVYRVSSI